MTKKAVKPEVCNYVVSDFTGEAAERPCGRPSMATIKFKKPFAHFGTMWYCKRHWEMAEDYIPEPFKPTFLVGEAV